MNAKFKDGVVLKVESAGIEVNILTLKCPKCGSSYRIPWVIRSGKDGMPKCCPYCGKKLVKRR